MKPDNMKVGSLFSGIGGFDYGLKRAGMQIVWQSEIEPYCCEVLKKHWPNVPNLGDIFGIKDPPAVDLICGGFPCQPFSVAGKRQGKADDRYLWPEMLRIIQKVRPAWVFAENVPGIIGMELNQVLSDLESEGYETGTIIIPACALNAPHRRDRVWIVAYNNDPRSGEQVQTNRIGQTNDHRREGQSQFEPCETDRHAPDSAVQGLEGSITEGQTCPTGCFAEYHDGSIGWQESWLEVATRLCRVDDGLPAWVHRHRVKRLKALGNAIIPQIAEVLGKMIIEIDQRFCYDRS